MPRPNTLEGIFVYFGYKIVPILTQPVYRPIRYIRYDAWICLYLFQSNVYLTLLIVWAIKSNNSCLPVRYSDELMK